MPQDKRDEALAKTIQELNKRFGEGTLIRLGDMRKSNVASISTGSIALDEAIGVGGIPRGRITEIYGAESSGKTTICLHTAAECQRAGGTVAFIDVEYAFDEQYALMLSVDRAKFVLVQPDSAEQALESCDELIRTGAVDLVILDSVAALVPQAEISGEMGDSHMGLQARLMSQALRKLAGVIGTTNTAMIFTNQLREKIGVVYGNPEITTGGRALKFYASVRLDVKRIESIKSGTEILGNRVRVRVSKNKVAVPFRQAEFDIMFNEGISKTGDVLDLAVQRNIIEKRGSFYRYEDTIIGQGRESAKAYLKENNKMFQSIRNLLTSEV